MTDMKKNIKRTAVLSMVLVLMFAMEMIAVLLTLAGESFGTYDGLRLLVLSVYLQWMGLCGAAVLCLARRSLRIVVRM